MISNDLENAQIANTSKGIISDETIIKNHPWVEDPEKEINKIQSEQKENEYENIIPSDVNNTENKDGDKDDK